MTRGYMWHDSFICMCGTWLADIGTLSVRYLYVGHDSWIYVTWFIHMYVWDMTRWHSQRDMTHSCVRHASFIYVTWFVHTWDMTHSYLWHYSLIFARPTHNVSYETLPLHEWNVRRDSFISHTCATWLVRVTYVCDMTRSYHINVRRDWFVSHYTCVRRDSFVSNICATWVVRVTHMCDVTRSCHTYVRHDSFISHICATWLVRITYMCDVTRSYQIYMCDVTGSCVIRITNKSRPRDSFVTDWCGPIFSTSICVTELLMMRENPF